MIWVDDCPGFSSGKQKSAERELVVLEFLAE